MKFGITIEVSEVQFLNTPLRIVVMEFATTMKGGGIKPVDFVILEECTDAYLFLQFVRILQGTLVQGDVRTVDNW